MRHSLSKCPLCEREQVPLSDHHLIPQCRGGQGGEKAQICTSCHEAVHQTFSNKELESTYNTVDALLGHEVFARTVRFISKQHGKVRTAINNKQRRRGRNG